MEDTRHYCRRNVQWLSWKAKRLKTDLVVDVIIMLSDFEWGYESTKRLRWQNVKNMMPQYGIID